MGVGVGEWVRRVCGGAGLGTGGREGRRAHNISPVELEIKGVLSFAVIWVQLLRKCGVWGF